MGRTAQHFSVEWTVRVWNPGWTRNFFSVSVQADPVPHPAISMMDAGASFPGMKRPELGVEHPPSSSAKGN